jgi:hypothetical protein
MNDVWQHSRNKGAPLLLLLALADFANDDGVCWPSMATLARKVRVTTTRAIQQLIVKLRASGELIQEKDAGPNRTHLFRVNISSHATISSHANVSSTRTSTHDTANVSSQDPEEERQKTANVSSHKPSIEPSIEPSMNHQSVDGAFERFWDAYPKKRKKQDTLQAWKKLKPSSALSDKIIEAVERQKTSHDWKKDNGQYIPYPAKWLRAGQWDDEVNGDDSKYVMVLGRRKPRYIPKQR